MQMIWIILFYYIIYIANKYTKKLLRKYGYILKRAMLKIHDSSKKLNIQVLNEVNRNILITSGKKIKRDSLSNVNEKG